MAHVFGLCFSLLSTFATASTVGAVNQVGCSSVKVIASVVLECNKSNLDVELKDGNESLEKLAKHLPRTVRALRIVIPGGSVSVEGFGALGAALPKKLQSLDLGLEGTNIDNTMANAFVTDLSNKVKKLQSLDLNFKHTKVTIAGIQDVASSLPELEELSLNVTVDVTEVTVASLEHLSDALSERVQSLFLEILEESGEVTKTLDILFKLEYDLPKRGCDPVIVVWDLRSQTSYLTAKCPTIPPPNSSTIPPSTQPPTTTPCSTQPPTTNPPSTQPPTTNPASTPTTSPGPSTPTISQRYVYP